MSLRKWHKEVKGVSDKTMLSYQESMKIASLLRQAKQVKQIRQHGSGGQMSRPTPGTRHYQVSPGQWVAIDEEGNELWTNSRGLMHRGDDKPAIVKVAGTRIWMVNGKIHRSGGQPAIIRDNGDREWWVDGKPHSENDLPAIVMGTGTQMWLKHGKRYRDGGKPAVIWDDGSKEWWVDGKLVNEEVIS